MIFKQTCPISLTSITLLLWLLHDTGLHYALLPIIFIAGQFWDPLWADMKCNRPIISHQQTFWIWLSIVRLWICLCWDSRVNYEGPIGSGFAQGWPYGSGICCVYIEKGGMFNWYSTMLHKHPQWGRRGTDLQGTTSNNQCRLRQTMLL